MSNTPEQEFAALFNKLYDVSLLVGDTAADGKNWREGIWVLIEKHYLPKAQVEAAIGENETPTELGNYWNVGRNQLRADIREKLGLKKG